MSFRRRAVVAALMALASWPAAACAAAPVGLTAGFDPGARLGASTAMHIGLHIDSRRLPSPVTSLQLLYPKGLGLVTSGLGLASCARAPSDFQAVLIHGRGLAGCPPNAVMGYGTARAEVRVINGPVIPEYATLTLLAGTLQQGVLGLVIYVDGQHPFGAKLAYAGEVGGAPAQFGGAIGVALPAIPSVADLAVVALVDLHLSIGTRTITYYKRHGHKVIAYHPNGIGLPNECPRGGFHFRALLTFQSGGRATANATVSCRQLAPAIEN